MKNGLVQLLEEVENRTNAGMGGVVIGLDCRKWNEPAPSVALHIMYISHQPANNCAWAGEKWEGN